MALRLDLSPSDAKIARAREHARTLTVESDRLTQERNPYGMRMVEIDSKRGWFAIYLNYIQHPAEFSLGIIFGDVIHNLRSALDYIVTELVVASSATLTASHQFPIFSKRGPYENCVGTAVSAVPLTKRRKGPLDGITVGLQEIWDLQPFHRAIDPRGDPLALIQRFSNADKHRVVALDMSYFKQSAIRVFPEGVVERIENQSPPDWGVQKEYEIARIRYATPSPRNVELQGEITVEVHFATPSFGNLRGIVIPIGSVDATCDYVAQIVEKFKAL